MRHFITFISLLFLAGCNSAQNTATPPIQDDAGMYKEATFAGGCFWCMEAPFESLPGVKQVISGFAGGTGIAPSYKDVASGTTDFREAVQITYDPRILPYETLLDTYWRQINPTDDGGQFVDRGFQYTSAIFYHTPTQKTMAQESKENLATRGVYGSEPLLTPILPYTTFYPAEAYHQDYYKNNRFRYQLYRNGSGRDQFLEPIWGKATTY